MARLKGGVLAHTDTSSRARSEFIRHCSVNPRKTAWIVGRIAWRAMINVLAVFLLAVELGTGFGTASAELFSTTSNAMEIELRVEVKQSADTVVAHLSFPDQNPVTLPLVSREQGVFGIRTEVSRFNYQVVFETVGDTGAQSTPHSLVELGLEFPADTTSTTATSLDQGFTSATTNWGWLAIALGAAALSLLALWVLGGDDQAESEESTDEDVEDLKES